MLENWLKDLAFIELLSNRECHTIFSVTPETSNAETPKRLKPRSEVARDLYLMSGNRCAYHGCSTPLMREDGVLVGEIAHIEAALPEGRRFRAEMTNEERRAFSNLLLLCAVHHKVIDSNKTPWTVEELVELKRKHEAIYTNVVEKLRTAIVDETEGETWKLPSNLDGLFGDSPFSLNAEQMEAEIALVDRLAGRLASLSVGTRTLLSLIVTRGTATHLEGEFEITHALLKSLVNISDRELLDELTILEETKFIWIDTDEYPVRIIVRVATQPADWTLFQDVKSLAKGDAERIRAVLVGLDFRLLEGA